MINESSSRASIAAKDSQVVFVPAASQATVPEQKTQAVVLESKAKVRIL